MPAIVYRVDEQDRLSGFNEEWDRFALANAAPHLESRLILGRRLWDFVSDAPTRSLYRQLLQRARSGRSAAFDFRCDSPTLKRTLRLSLLPGAPGEVELSVDTLRLEPRPYAALLDPAAPKAGALVRACGWCKRVWCGSGWHEVEDAVELLGLMREGAAPPLTHGLCPDCEARVNAELDAMGA
jgi:hypothetical protein